MGGEISVESVSNSSFINIDVLIEVAKLFKLGNKHIKKLWDIFVDGNKVLSLLFSFLLAMPLRYLTAVCLLSESQRAC